MTRVVDALALGWYGVRSRPGRAVLSALGIALGIATLVLVTAIPASGKADLERRLDALGTNLLVAQSNTSPAPDEAPASFDPRVGAMIGRIPPVESVTTVGNLNVRVLRDDHADPNLTAGILTLAADPHLLTPLDARVASGTFLTAASERLPAVVLGARAAEWLGITTVDPTQPRRVKVDRAWFTVVGVLAPTPLTPDLDQAVFVGWDAARTWVNPDAAPTTVYLRTAESQLEAVRAVLPPTMDPVTPGLVSVSRPSDALTAKRAAQGTFSGLFLGLAAVALVVGGVGVANTMIVTVLERRREIGLRRALGATRRDVRRQFVVESVLLSSLGGLAGAALGAAGAVGYALSRDWPVVVPATSVGGGVAGAVLVGAVAGLYPAVRASLVPPTSALAGT